jgi:hypothetical protein
LGWGNAVQHFVAYYNSDKEGRRFNNGRKAPRLMGYFKAFSSDDFGGPLWGIEGGGLPKRYRW